LTGVQFKTYTELDKEFNETRLFAYDHYLMVESHPKIKNRIDKQISKIHNEVKAYIKTHAEKP